MFNIGKHFGLFDTDEFDILRRETVTDSDGAEIETEPRVVASHKCHCSISSADIPDSVTHGTSPTQMTLQIDFDSTIDLQNNDYVIVRRFEDGRILGTYKGNVSAISLYPSRKRAFIDMDVDA